MDEKFLAWNLDINDGLTSSLTSQVMVVALAIASICFTGNLMYNYLSSGFKKFVGDGSEPFPDYTEIARCIVIIICITSYLPIARTLVGTMEAINKATSVEHVDYIMAYAKMEQANAAPEMDGQLETDGTQVIVNFENEQATSEEDSGGISKLISDIGKLVMMLDPRNLAALLFHGVCYMIVGIIKLVITGVIVILTKVLVIIGPLAFAFSILPCFRKQLEVWFGTLLTTGLTLTTVNILHAIMDATTGHLFGNQAGDLLESEAEKSLIMALDCVMIILYCSCFWLTSKFVGKGDAGRVLSKLVSTTTALAAMALTGGTSAAATGAASSGSLVSGAANVGKSAIEE